MNLLVATFAVGLALLSVGGFSNLLHFEIGGRILLAACLCAFCLWLTPRWHLFPVPTTSIRTSSDTKEHDRRKLDPDRFYPPFPFHHGQPLEDLERVVTALRKACTAPGEAAGKESGLLFFLSDSYLDNKAYVRAYENGFRMNTTSSGTSEERASTPLPGGPTITPWRVSTAGSDSEVAGSGYEDVLSEMDQDFAFWVTKILREQPRQPRSSSAGDSLGLSAAVNVGFAGSQLWQWAAPHPVHAGLARLFLTDFRHRTNFLKKHLGAQDTLLIHLGGNDVMKALMFADGLLLSLFWRALRWGEAGIDAPMEEMVVLFAKHVRENFALLWRDRLGLGGSCCSAGAGGGVDLHTVTSDGVGEPQKTTPTPLADSSEKMQQLSSQPRTGEVQVVCPRKVVLLTMPMVGWFPMWLFPAKWNFGERVKNALNRGFRTGVKQAFADMGKDQIPVWVEIIDTPMDAEHLNYDYTSDHLHLNRRGSEWVARDVLAKMVEKNLGERS